MPERPYRHIRQEELIVRDHLAVERTVLANERTLLAYIRTALGSLVGGASLIQFFDLAWAYILGWLLIAAVPVLMALGAWRFIRVHRDLKMLHTSSPRAEDT